MNAQTVTVLLIEDDEVDVLAVRRAFRDQKVANPIVVARDGMEALSILRGTDGHEPLPRPYVILLDLNMPRMSGLEFLAAVRADEALRASVIFVLTTSSDDEDRAAAYDKNVAGYIVKEEAGTTFVQLISMMDCYWRVVELP